MYKEKFEAIYEDFQNLNKLLIKETRKNQILKSALEKS
jgi:hypothetical protein